MTVGSPAGHPRRALWRPRVAAAAELLVKAAAADWAGSGPIVISGPLELVVRAEVARSWWCGQLVVLRRSGEWSSGHRQGLAVLEGTSLGTGRSLLSLRLLQPSRSPWRTVTAAEAHEMARLLRDGIERSAGAALAPARGASSSVVPGPASWFTRPPHHDPRRPPEPGRQGVRASTVDHA